MRIARRDKSRMEPGASSFPALSCDGHVQTKSEGGCEWSR